MLLVKSENLTPQPPSLQGKGEPESPSPLLLGVGEGSDLVEVTLPTGSFIPRRVVATGARYRLIKINLESLGRDFQLQ